MSAPATAQAWTQAMLRLHLAQDAVAAPGRVWRPIKSASRIGAWAAGPVSLSTMKAEQHVDVTG